VNARRRGVGIVLGTRPEMVKLAEVARLLGDDARIFHTGQHDDDAMSREMWRALAMPEPDKVLNVGGRSRARQVADATSQLDEIFAVAPPAAVIVQGDSNATLAGALAANARHIPLVHVEAGLRSFDRTMPEEHNRVMVDHIADVLCAPSQVNRENLRAENISDRRIEVTGNTVVEAVRSQMPSAWSTLACLDALGARTGDYVLATIHRPENTDDVRALAMILGQLGAVDAQVILPLHPRTMARVQGYGLGHLLEPLTVIEPLAPPQFLALAAHSAALVSDSGGLQEECSVLKRPLLVVRRSTERPEVIGTFAERTTPGPEISQIVNEWLANLAHIHHRLASMPSPYGDGRASARIVQIVLEIADLQSDPLPNAT